MIDSFRYGVPLALVAFLLLMAQATEWLPINPMLRWFLVAVVGGATVLWSIKRRNVAYFPFRFAFLSLFNISIIAAFVQGALMWIFKGDLQGEVPPEISPSKWMLSIIFFETMGFLFLFMICAALLSLLFTFKKKA